MNFLIVGVQDHPGKNVKNVKIITKEPLEVLGINQNASSRRPRKGKLHFTTFLTITKQNVRTSDEDDLNKK